jgi:hypothetical protein
MMGARVICLLLVVAGLLATTAACSVSSSADDLPEASFARIDEVEGTYGGVGIGDSREDVWRVFGRKSRVGHNEGFQPTGAGDDFFGPNYIPAETGYAYEDVLFWFPLEDLHLGRGSPLRGKQDQVAGFQVTAPGVRTLRGIGAGDSLEDAKDAYPELDCGDAPAGDYATYHYCSGRIAEERHIWFGGDPIMNISVSRSPL